MVKGKHIDNLKVSMIHDLKIKPVYFEQKMQGLKPWELRLNDRDFRVGDILCLHEFDENGYTGRQIYQSIDLLFRDENLLAPNVVLLSGICFATPKESEKKGISE